MVVPLIVKPRQSSAKGRGVAAPFLAIVACFGALAVARGIALPVGFFFVGVGVLFGGSSVWLAAWKRRVEVVVEGDQILVTSFFGDRRGIASRDHGSVAIVEVTPERLPWMVWLDDRGTPTWAALGRNWPIDELERLAIDAGLRSAPTPGTMTREEFFARYPGAVTWFQRNSLTLFLTVMTAIGVVAVVGGSIMLNR